MPKSQNLPKTTRELTSNAKAREFLLPSWSWGSHHHRHSGYGEEPRALGYNAYRVFSQEKFEKREFPGWEMSNWLPSVEGLGVGFWLVPISRAGHGFWLVPISRAGHRFWLVRRWWGGVKGFPRSSFPGNFYKMESSLTKRGGLGSSCVWLIWIVVRQKPTQHCNFPPIEK